MLTVNPAEHPLMNRFHKPDSEKRSLVIVPRDAYADWLSCKSTEEARTCLNLFPPMQCGQKLSRCHPEDPATSPQ
jgi:hypothetical protein